MNRIVLYFIVLTFPSFAFNQSNETYQTEIYGPQTYNPASYGTWNQFSLNSTFRSQLNLRSLNNTVEGKIKLSKKAEKKRGFFGVGASYTFVDGLSTSLDNSHFVNLNMNYQLPLGKSFISFGLAPGISLASYFPASWASIPTNDRHFTLGAGIQWYNEDGYIGVYGSDLLARGLSESGITLPRYYAEAAYRIRIRRRFSLLPTAKYSIIDSFHAGSVLLLAEIDKAHLRIGVGYELRSALLLTASTYFKNFELSYNFGLNSSSLSNQGWNTHELRLSYRLAHEFPRPSKTITPPF